MERRTAREMGVLNGIGGCGLDYLLRIGPIDGLEGFG
jgi:hypothetical protein